MLKHVSSLAVKPGHMSLIGIVAPGRKCFQYSQQRRFVNNYTMNCNFIMFHPCFIEATVFPPGFCRQPLILGLLPLTLRYGRRCARQMRHRLGRSTLAHLQRTAVIRMIYSSCIDVMIILQTSLPKNTSLWKSLEKLYIYPPSHSQTCLILTPLGLRKLQLANCAPFWFQMDRFFHMFRASLWMLTSWWKTERGGKFSFELSSQVPRKLD